MRLPIIWSPRSRKDFLSILDYLIEEWGEKQAIKLADRVDEALELIAEMPQMYPATTRIPNVRRCVIVKQVTLYYRIRKKQIELITFFDPRQDPKKLKL